MKSTRLLTLLLISSGSLLFLNLMALYIFSPGTTECVSRYKQYEQNVYLLESELQALRHEVKTAWELLGHTNNIRSVKGMTYTPAQSARTASSTATIVMVTPTYARWTQKADLTRLCQTLMHVHDLVWIVVEDSINKTKLVTDFLVKCKVEYVHLNIRTSANLQLEKKEPTWKKNRGVEQRNIALKWIRENFAATSKKRHRSVLYFGDDDNTYDLELFNEIRSTQRVTVWPVGICGGLRWEGPVCEDNRVVTWHTAWAKQRPFPIDFAGFAVNIDLILKHSNVTINPLSRTGWLESDFLTQLISPNDVRGGADNCMKVNVWHTRTEAPKSRDEEKLIKLGQPSNPLVET